jgi:ATP-binding cassette, subfamily B, bacterial PglK
LLLDNYKKLINIFSIEENKTSIQLLFLILFSSIIEVSGVASILPFIAIISNPNLIEDNLLIFYIYQKSGILGIQSTGDFIKLIGGLVFLLLIFSLGARAITHYFQLRFSLMREYSISKNLIQNHLSQSYIWFLNQNSAYLKNKILLDVYNLVNKSLLPSLYFISNIITVIGLLIVLLIFYPIITLILIFFFSSFYLIITLSFKIINYSLGEKRFKLGQIRSKILSEVYTGIKQLKVRNLEKFYTDNFSKVSYEYAKKSCFGDMISFLPRYLIEAVMFGGAVIFILALMNFYSNIQSYIAILALFTFAGYRILPSLNQIYIAVAQITFNYPTLVNIYNDLNKTQKKQTKNLHTIQFQKKIILKNIHFIYPTNKFTILKNVNLTIPFASKIGIIGLSGAGKTTLVDIILGLLSPSKGKISVDGNVITNNKIRAWQKNLGYVPQQIYLTDESILSNIAFGVEEKNIDKRIVEEVAKNINLHNFIINKLPKGYNTKVGELGNRLSGGERQRIGIARALYQRPKVLILDEATNSLDKLTEQKVIESIFDAAKNTTIIAISHQLSALKKCDQIFSLEKGQLKKINI